MQDAGVDARPPAAVDDEFERKVEALAHVPTGADLRGRDLALLAALGVLLPIVLLIWGWL